MRTRMPFIEALKRQQEESNGGTAVSEVKVAEPEAKVDLSPKTMSESYHRVVSLLSGKKKRLPLSAC
jgi:hypothetical protein